MASQERFVNLHQHTTESHLDAICDIDKLFDRVKELGQSAIAVTDHGSMGGIYRAYKAAKRTGVKLIPGNEVYFVTDLEALAKDPETKEVNPNFKRYHLVLLAANHTGYKNLLRITYEGFKHSVTVMGKEFPRVDEAILRKHSEGLFALSACGGNIIAQSVMNKDEPRAIKYAHLLKDIFGDRFFIELQPHNIVKKNGLSQRDLNNRMKQIAEQADIPMVATCDAHYIKPEDEKIHDMILAICDKKPLEAFDRHRYASQIPCQACEGRGYVDNKKNKCPECVKGIVGYIPCIEFYVKNESEIRSYFSDSYSPEFAETLISNVEKIAAACEFPHYMEPGKKEHIPRFDMTHISQCPDHMDFVEWRANKPKMASAPDDVAYLKYICWKEFSNYTKDMSKEERDTYWRRLVAEIEVLEMRDFCSYMLIVADYIRWAREHSILVGVGRGSVGGCLTAFFLGIHRLDSIKYGLLFERFQNKEKKSLPDVDSDFASSGREQVIEYVRQKYGEENVAAISNINTFTPKVVIKDVARSLIIGGDKSESFRIANVATADIPMKGHLPDGRTTEIDTLAKALEFATGPNLAALLDRHTEIREYAEAIIGLPRAYSTHAAGIVISDVPLPEFVPLRRDKKGTFAVQFDKGETEEVGLVKMDFLGLTTLETLKDTIEGAKKIGVDLLTPDQLVDDCEDQKVFDLIGTGFVTGLFQLEGDTLQPLCKPMKPRCVEDLALINALGRPNVSKEQRKMFIDRRDGKSKVTYPHPMLADILAPTLGFSLYEEDLMKIANKFAGWDLSKADNLRKLTKLKEKGADLAKKVEDEFIADAIKYANLPVSEATMIWNDVIIPYTKYGFNKSHAIAYGLTGYITAYYKTYARAPFYAAILNNSNTPDNASYLDEIKKDARRFGVEIAACDINQSTDKYVAVSKKKLVTGLKAIKGLGEKALEHIIRNQPYSSFEEFLFKVPSSVNKTAIQALAKAGAFDTFGVSRKYIFDNYADIREELNKYVSKADVSKFEMGDKTRPRPDILDDFKFSKAHLSKEEWITQDKLAYEKEVLGEYVSGSVRDLHPQFYKGGIYDTSLANLKNMAKDQTMLMEGIVTEVKEVVIKKKGKLENQVMAKLVVQNLRGETIAVTVWPSDYVKYQKILENPNIAIRGTFTVNEYLGEKSLVLKAAEFFKG